MMGVLPVDKPAGPTSHDVVAAARRALGIRRIGHTGTLDPFATGLLDLCIGPATRLAEYLMGMDKSYQATARLGVATDTLDGEGTVVAESDAVAALDPAQVRAAFEDQQGRRMQTPPAYSAKKVGGKKAYELARAGRAVELEPVEVTIHELAVLAVDGPTVGFRIRCSSGTYVRAVARDAGEALGVGAHLTALRRTAVGRFRVADAVEMDRLDEHDAVAAALLSPLQAVAHLPTVLVDADQVRRIRHGQALAVDGLPEGLVAVADDAGLVAIAEAGGGRVRPRKVLR